MMELVIVVVFGTIAGLRIIRKRRHIQGALYAGLLILAIASVSAVVSGRELSDVFKLLTLREGTAHAVWLAPMVTSAYVLLLACIIGQIRSLIGARVQGSTNGDI